MNEICLTFMHSILNLELQISITIACHLSDVGQMVNTLCQILSLFRDIACQFSTLDECISGIIKISLHLTN